MSAPRRFAVIGGGIAGLTAAYDLHQQGHQVHLFEAGDQVGGKIQTSPFAGLDLDRGPDSVLARVPFAVDLMRRLGLEDEMVPQPPGSAYIYSRGELRRIPDGNVLGIPVDLDALAASGVVSAAAVARAAEDLDRPDDRPEGDESVGSLIRRRLGDEILERLVDPLLGGINAGDSDHLSLAAGAPQIAAAAAGQHASLIEALRAQRAAAPAPPPGEAPAPVFYTLRSGLGRLIDALVATVGEGENPVAIRTSSPVTGLVPAPDGGWTVHTDGLMPADGGAGTADEVGEGRGTADGLQVDGVVIAAPAFVATELLGAVAPEAAKGLASIDYSSVALLALAFPDSAAGRPLDSSGFLVPRVEGLLLTAGSWSSSKWPHLARPGQFLVRASAGRFGDDRALEMDDDELLAAILADLRTTMDLRGEPDEVRITRWHRSFPQYTPGHLDRVAAIEAALTAAAPGIALAGAAYRGVGIPACINSAHQAVAALTAPA